MINTKEAKIRKKKEFIQKNKKYRKQLKRNRNKQHKSNHMYKIRFNSPALDMKAALKACSIKATFKSNTS